MSEGGIQTQVAKARAGAAPAPRSTTSVRADETPGLPDPRAVWAALGEVPDPEMPVVSIVDLGMVDVVKVTTGGIRVELLPTFIGCPALDVIRSRAEERLGAFGRPVDIVFKFAPPWSTDRITTTGRERLRSAGLGPPVADRAGSTCPHCGSRDVAMDNLFGSTRCRSLLYCRACRQPFEQFKSV